MDEGGEQQIQMQTKEKCIKCSPSLPSPTQREALLRICCPSRLFPRLHIYKNEVRHIILQHFVVVFSLPKSVLLLLYFLNKV